MQTHICNGHYMYGDTFVQPDLPGYDNCWNHQLAPAERPLPPYPDLPDKPATPNLVRQCNYYCKDTNTRVEVPYADNSVKQSLCDTCTKNGICNTEVTRDPSLNNIVNIETTVQKILKITLYGTSKELDKTIEMKLGDRYAITYVTEHGKFVDIGFLDLIGDSVPDECIRYMNTYNKTVASTAYIGLDCSTEGHADKRKIYIASIRDIMPVLDFVPPEEEQKQEEPLPEPEVAKDTTTTEGYADQPTLNVGA